MSDRKAWRRSGNCLRYEAGGRHRGRLVGRDEHRQQLLLRTGVVSRAALPRGLGLWPVRYGSW